MLSLFSTINLAYVQEINIFGGGYSVLRHLNNVYWDCKLEHWKIATHGHQYTKPTEDEEGFALNKCS